MAIDDVKASLMFYCTEQGWRRPISSIVFCICTGNMYYRTCTYRYCSHYSDNLWFSKLLSIHNLQGNSGFLNPLRKKDITIRLIQKYLSVRKVWNLFCDLNEIYIFSICIIYLDREYIFYTTCIYSIVYYII